MTRILRFTMLCLLAWIGPHKLDARGSNTATPIKHLVVIFQENRTFDNYFATYPFAENLPRETPFKPEKKTPHVNGLTFALLTQNQNLVQPFRLAPSQA